jgi:hypothetical protein
MIDRDSGCGTGDCNFGGQTLKAASLLAIGGVQILVARCVMQGVCGRIFPRASIFTAEVVITESTRMWKFPTAVRREWLRSRSWSHSTKVTATSTDVGYRRAHALAKISHYWQTVLSKIEQREPFVTRLFGTPAETPAFPPP